MSHFFLNIMHSHVLAVSQNRDDKSFRSRDCNTNINEISVNHVFSIDDGIDYRLLLKSKG
jgi:hypothetical protein